MSINLPGLDFQFGPLGETITALRDTIQAALRSTAPSEEGKETK